MKENSFVKSTSEVPSENIYKKEAFNPENASEYSFNLIKDFSDFFKEKGYVKKEAVSICSGIDPTVRFIGSHISVLKPFLENEEITSPGIYMDQECIRTKNIKDLYNDGKFPNWGSYFISLGVLSPAERLPEACGDSFEFFQKKLNINVALLKVRVSSTDNDLLQVCQEVFPEETIEKDSKPLPYYRHKIGMENVAGRNFNIALKNCEDDEFNDIGNIIILEKGDKQVGVELAFGVSTILKQQYNLEHVLDCTPVKGIESEYPDIKRKFEDSIVTSSKLFSEGLRPLGSHNRNRLLKSYVRSLSYFRAKTGMPLNKLQEVISNFNSKNKYINQDDGSLIVEFVHAFENDLLVKGANTEEEYKILAAMKLNKNI